MEGLKNMIVIKNIPSNIVEEAFIVVKANLKIDKLEIDNKNKGEKRYIVKEAEDIIRNCETIIEKSEESKTIKNMEKKYKRLKTLTIWFGILAIMGAIINFF